MNEQSHVITRLAVHLPNQQTVYFTEGDEENALEKAEYTDSTLTAWFKLNTSDATAQNLFYHQVPNHYTFQSKTKQWVKRKLISNEVIGRMYLVNPNEGERYFLRLLLLNVKGIFN